MAERQTDKKIKILRSDNGTEFVNRTFDKFLKQTGIKRQLTVPHTPQQNGVAERFNRTVVEMARSMVVAAGVDEALWAEAVNTAVYLRNRAPTKALCDKTPYEVWFKRKPDVSHLKTFGSIAIALDKKHYGKFRPKGKEYLMVGYSDESKAYRLMDKATQKIIVSRDVYFVESLANNESVEVIIEDKITNCVEVKYESKEAEIYADSTNEKLKDEPTEKIGPGRPKKILTGVRGRPSKQYNVVNFARAGDIEIPQTVDEALGSEYAESWWQAMQREYHALLSNDTWELTELPQGQKTIGSKWVFSLKTDKNGKVERFKARLVAKGCSQTYGVNYTETFSPVVRYESIRMVFAFAAEFQLHLHQMDVSTAYLNSELNDDVFMAQPKKFVDENSPHCVLRLKKAIYGLKQSGRQWNQKINLILKGIGFSQCESEPCLYVKKENGNFSLIALYVDDLLIASSNIDELNQIKSRISQIIDVVDKGEVSYFISMEVERKEPKGTIRISQRAQIRQLLRQYRMENCRPVTTPLEPKYQIRCENDKLILCNTNLSLAH